MAVLQVYQAKLLRAMDESGLEHSAAFRELRSATNLALRATKTTAQVIGRSMASLVVLERHLWLDLTQPSARPEPRQCSRSAKRYPFPEVPGNPAQDCAGPCTSEAILIPQEGRGGGKLIKVDQACIAALAPWKDPSWFKQGVPLGMMHKRKVIFTDASNTGWGALCDGRPAFGAWSSEETKLHINCLEMLAVWQALQSFLPHLEGCHVLVRSDNMTVVSYINRQGGLSSPRLFRMAKSLLEWAHCHLRSLKAAHIPGKLIQGADMLSRSNVPSGEWMLHPQTVQRIWEIFGKAEVDLFASEDNSHCPIYFSKERDALAHDWPSLLLYAFPPIALIPQVIRQIREKRHKVLLVAPLWRNQLWFSEMSQLLTAAPWPIPLRRDLLSQANMTIWHPQPKLWALHLWPLDGSL
ncbi:uncharacterized protein LOC107681650 [Sinocyclocheilus anshuiensis]|uniref:uncharacterized protein LOC107681650 n=1 Tax=Sinocyclocheilus anshuiensis TaxID=1608454 RepID=UPI0007B83C5C|nr:PREDICTED: uncharacterized protein LOC107681650 [Sinocyclocheilus anshuiensis]